MIMQKNENAAGMNPQKRDTQKTKSLKSLYQRLRSHISSHRINVWRLHGDSEENNRLVVAYAGREKNKEYLKNMVFGTACREENVGRIWKHQLRRVAGPKTSILVSEYDADQKNINDSDRGFMLPYWLGWIADISGDINKMVKSERTLKYNLGKVRKNNLEYEILDSHEAYETYYDTMYVPYMQRRFDSTAHFLTREEIQAERENCQLLYVKKGREYLSGLLIKYESEYPRNWAVGVKDANPEYMKTGAVGALYYFLITYLKEKGYHQVHFGGTRPFLGDGVLNYKKRWPIRSSGFTPQGFYIRITSKSAETINFLTRCPFIYLEKEKLNSAVFIGPDESLTPKKFKKMRKSYLINGMHKIVLYVFGEKANTIKEAIPEDYKDNFEVRCAENLII